MIVFILFVVDNILFYMFVFFLLYLKLCGYLLMILWKKCENVEKTNKSFIGITVSVF